MGKGCGSKGKKCLGVFRTAEKCNRARDGSGRPVFLNKNCMLCGEQRCKAHCKCFRDKSCKGRSMPRGIASRKARVSARTQPPPAALAVSASLVHVGRPSSLKCEKLDQDSWWKACLVDITDAAEVELASYMYDNFKLHGLLLKRLRGRSPFALSIFVDAEKFAGSVPKQQKARLRELCNSGAQVYICKGRAAGGAFHCKGLVVDRRYLFTGNANFTEKSLKNWELCFRMEGPPVKEVLLDLAAAKLKGKLWSGE